MTSSAVCNVSLAALYDGAVTPISRSSRGGSAACTSRSDHRASGVTIKGMQILFLYIEPFTAQCFTYNVTRITIIQRIKANYF